MQAYGGIDPDQIRQQALLSHLGSAPPGANPALSTLPMPSAPGPTNDFNLGGVSPAAPPPAAAAAASSASSYAAPSGWDSTKWNDPNKHDEKYDIGHLLAPIAAANGGNISSDQIKQMLPQIQALYPGTTFDGDTIKYANGQYADLIQGSKAGNGTGKFQYLDPTQHGGAAKGTIGAGGGSSALMPLLGSAGTAIGSALNGDGSSVYQNLVDRLKQMQAQSGGQPIDQQALLQLLNSATQGDATVNV
jgi:hypothetical protein